MILKEANRELAIDSLAAVVAGDRTTRILIYHDSSESNPDSLRDETGDRHSIIGDEADIVTLVSSS